MLLGGREDFFFNAKDAKAFAKSAKNRVEFIFGFVVLTLLLVDGGLA